LARSGIPAATARANGVYTEADPARVARLLGWERPASGLGDCLVFPYHDLDGRPTGYVRLKPDRPRAGDDGKAVKYEAPKGQPPRLYVVAGCLPAVFDPTVRLLITEGEKKALAAAQAGFVVVALSGVWSWCKKGSGEGGKPKELIDDLLRVPLRDRPVCLVFDSDRAGNRDVLRAEFELAGALRAEGATVKVVQLPPGPLAPSDDELLGEEERQATLVPSKQGLDDYLAAKGADGPAALRALLETAQDPRPPDELAERADDPFVLARTFLHPDLRWHGGNTVPRRYLFKLFSWNGDFYRWRRNGHALEPAGDLRARLAKHVKAQLDEAHKAALEGWKEEVKSEESDVKKPKPVKVTKQLVADTALALAGLALLPAGSRPPLWLGGRGPWPPGEVLACKNGLLHLPGLVAGKDVKDCFRPPRPDFFSPHRPLAFDFDPAAPAPSAWLAFLAQLWPDDPKAVAALQDWFGYCLTADTHQHKILLVVGPRRSGKGTIARVLAGLVGDANYCGPTLAGLGANFGLWPLLGKTVAVISDARLSNRTDVAQVTERLLSISGEDKQTVDRKYQEPVTTKLTARFMILTNELPRLNDASGALASRLIALRLVHSFYGREDHGLTGKLLKELPGILLWAAEGWRRLRERGHFEQPESGLEMAQEMEDLSSPVGAFVRECCALGPGYEVGVRELFTHWQTWCLDRGRKEPGTEQTFGRDLLAAVPGLGRRKLRTEGGRVRTYLGIRLRGSDEPEPDDSVVGEGG
jgi:putative DNA primase/helicase